MSMKAIDISYCQGAVDFNAVKNDGIEAVIIRCGYGRSVSQKDRWFDSNYDRAVSAGMHVGAYWYSYCESVEDARSEAKACIEVLGNRKFDLPIYFDIEEPSVLGRGKDFVSECINTFCGELERAGYFAGFYTSKSVAERLIHDEIRERYCAWVAQWNSTDDYEGQHGAWQYSERGQVRGVIGSVDLDIIYVDYPSIIVSGGFNNYPKQENCQSNAEPASVEPAETKPAETKPADVETYTIVSGDTLSGIAKKYRTTVKRLMTLNPKIENADLIYAGDVIFVPAGRV